MQAIQKLFWRSLFLQSFSSSTHVSLLSRIQLETFKLLIKLSFSGTECPPLRRQMVSRWKDPVMWMLNALFCSCWITRYPCVHQLDDLCAFSANGPLTEWLLFVPSPLSTNWTLVWPVCLVCTHRRVPASCRLSGSTLKTTSCRIVTRKSTSTATVTLDRSAIYRFIFLITLLCRMHLNQTLSFNIWLVFYSTFQIFGCGRMRFAEIPMKLAGLLQHPDPIIINHTIR